MMLWIKVAIFCFFVFYFLFFRVLFIYIYYILYIYNICYVGPLTLTLAKSSAVRDTRRKRRYEVANAVAEEKLLMSLAWTSSVCELLILLSQDRPTRNFLL